MCARLIVLDTLARVVGLEDRPLLPLLPDEIVEDQVSPDGLVAELLREARGNVCVKPNGRLSREGTPGLLVPGSFNPLHHGHLGLAAAAASRTGRPAAFELSVVNVDKPPLAEREVRRRVAQFAWRAEIWLTRSPTSSRRPGCSPGPSSWSGPTPPSGSSTRGITATARSG